MHSNYPNIINMYIHIYNAATQLSNGSVVGFEYLFDIYVKKPQQECVIRNTRYTEGITGKKGSTFRVSVKMHIDEFPKKYVDNLF